MKKKYNLLFILVISVSSYNCSLNLNSINSTLNYTVNNNIRSRIITGNVRNKGFTAKSVSAGFSYKSQIFMSYSDNYPVESLRGKIISTGLSNDQGFFFLITKNNFTPSLGDIFTLESNMRSLTPSRNNISMRTILRWNGKEYENIIKGKNYINSTTTAISIIAKYKNINLNNVIGQLKEQDNKFLINKNNAITMNLISYVKDLVEECLISGNDPISSIKYNNNNFYILAKGKISFISGCAGDCKGKPFVKPEKEIKEIIEDPLPGYKENAPLSLSQERIAFSKYYEEAIASVDTNLGDEKTLLYGSGGELKDIDNGNKIAISPAYRELYIMNSDGSNKKNFFEQELPSEYYANLNWINDAGDKILLVKSIESETFTYSQLYVSDGISFIPITEENENIYPMSFSPDGKKVLYFIQKYDSSGNVIINESGLYIYNIENSSKTKIILPPSGRGINSAVWFHDSSKILIVPEFAYDYHYSDYYNYTGYYDSYNKELYIVGEEGSVIGRLPFPNTSYVMGIKNASMSYDDKLISFVSDDGLAIMNSDGTNVRLLIRTDRYSPIFYPAKWSRDSKSLTARNWLTSIDGNNKRVIEGSNHIWIRKYDGTEVFPTPTPSPEPTPTPSCSDYDLYNPCPSPTPSCDDYDMYNPCPEPTPSCDDYDPYNPCPSPTPSPDPTPSCNDYDPYNPCS